MWKSPEKWPTKKSKRKGSLDGRSDGADSGKKTGKKSTFLLPSPQWSNMVYAFTKGQKKAMKKLFEEDYL